MDPKSAHQSYRKLSAASYEVSATQWILIYALSAILLAIVLFLVITQVISLYSPTKYDSNLISPNHPTPIQNQTDQTLDTSTWKTYTNNKHSFSIKYPSTWVVQENNPRQGDFQAIYLSNKQDRTSISFLFPRNPDSHNLNTALIKKEKINIGDTPTEFNYFTTNVTKELGAYSYEVNRIPFNLIIFYLDNDNRDKDLEVVKQILGSYKKLF